MGQEQVFKKGDLLKSLRPVETAGGNTFPKGTFYTVVDIMETPEGEPCRYYLQSGIYGNTFGVAKAHMNSVFKKVKESAGYETQTEYNRSMIRSYHRKLGMYRHGLKCRDRWLRRRGQSRFTTKDPIYLSLYKKVDKYYRILSKKLGKKYV